jgi:SOS-response transcriptional repressor LexA
MMLRGIRGTYVYVCDENLRDYFQKHITQYRNDQPSKTIAITDTKQNYSVPFYDIRVAAGEFSELQEGSISKWIELPSTYRIKPDYFTCMVVGESMNKKIPNGSVCLFQKDPGGSREGKIVLAEHRNINDKDFGAGYTVKSYHSSKEVSEEGWSHKSISLKPQSADSAYKEITLSEDELSELKIVGIFIAVLGIIE